MKKIIFSTVILAMSSFCNAQTCPQGSQVFVQSGSAIKPFAPDGWHLYWSAINRLHSTDVQFSIAHWGESADPDAAVGRIRCHYGNPVISDRDYGVTIESDFLLARGRIEANSSWTGGLCADESNHNVNTCSF